jgi:hypothetical protein
LFEEVAVTKKFPLHRADSNMLKIWLTWLQPSLGVLGTALVLSNPLYTYAATKPATPRNITKVPTATSSQWSNLKSAGTRIDRELLSGMAVTPDFAVRQLALNSLGTPLASASAAPKFRPSARNPVASFVSPGATYPQLAKTTKQTKPQNKNSAMASVLARAINPQATIPVPGLYIGNSNPRVASKFVRTGKSVVPPVASATEIGAPTPLSAMMAVKPGIDPYPVVRPELMQKLERTIAANNVPTTKTAPYALNPIATIPPVKSQAVAPKTIVPQAKSTPYRSLDPIAAIPSGLQKLLGNNLNSQPIGSSTPVAKANTRTVNPLLALRQIGSPGTETVSTGVNAASLQLATAQVYTSVPKFNIPGETLLTAKQFKPVNDLVVVKRTPQNFTIADTSNRKTTYVTTLAPATKQSWTVANQQNNLGGLILGSPQLATSSRVATLLPAENTAAVGLPVRALVDIN